MNTSEVLFSNYSQIQAAEKIINEATEDVYDLFVGCDLAGDFLNKVYEFRKSVGELKRVYRRVAGEIRTESGAYTCINSDYGCYDGTKCRW